MIIDANAWAGHWPFRRLHYTGARGLGQVMSRTGTDLALVSPIEGAFYRDCLSAMRGMLEDEGWDPTRMRPVAIVNPAFPGWEGDFETMVGEMGCVALRLIPNYHGYRLYAPAAVDLVRRAQQAGLPVLVTMRMHDERSHHWCMAVPAVPVDDVRFLLRELPEGKFLLSQATFAEATALLPDLAQVADGAWEMSYKPPAFMVEKVVEEGHADRMLYGSGAVMQYPESLLLPVQEAPIADEARRAILSGNARRLFGERLGGGDDR
jgi:predicted TIM-barrel fold metal-dependent hydrolase